MFQHIKSFVDDFSKLEYSVVATILQPYLDGAKDVSEGFDTLNIDRYNDSKELKIGKNVFVVKYCAT